MERDQAPIRGRIINANHYGWQILRSCITARGFIHRVPRSNFRARLHLGILVDDGTLGFDETPDECWNDIAVGGAQGGVIRFSRARTQRAHLHRAMEFPARLERGDLRGLCPDPVCTRRRLKARSIRSATRVNQTRWWSTRRCSRIFIMSPMDGFILANTTSLAREMNTSS